MGIKCSVCKKTFKPKDVVFLDIYNGLNHVLCFQLPPSSIKDVNEYRIILDKYDFLNRS